MLFLVSSHGQGPGKMQGGNSPHHYENGLLDALNQFLLIT
jgi:hypothetical protein